MKKTYCIIGIAFALIGIFGVNHAAYAYTDKEDEQGCEYHYELGRAPWGCTVPDPQTGYTYTGTYSGAGPISFTKSYQDKISGKTKTVPIEDLISWCYPGKSGLECFTAQSECSASHDASNSGAGGECKQSWPRNTPAATPAPAPPTTTTTDNQQAPTPPPKASNQWCFTYTAGGAPYCANTKDLCDSVQKAEEVGTNPCAPQSSGLSTVGCGDNKFCFKPIVSVPLQNGGSVNGNTSLSCYLNSMFSLAITVAAALAVIMIVIDGFKYMTSEAAGNKKDALSGIRSALLGLILLLSSWFILNIIDPHILSLHILNIDSTDGKGCLAPPSPSTVETQTPPRAAAVPNPLNNPPLTSVGGGSPVTSGSAPRASWCYVANNSTKLCFSSQSECANPGPTLRSDPELAPASPCTQTTPSADAEWCYTSSAGSVSCALSGPNSQQQCINSRKLSNDPKASLCAPKSKP